VRERNKTAVIRQTSEEEHDINYFEQLRRKMAENYKNMKQRRQDRGSWKIGKRQQRDSRPSEEEDTNQQG